MRRSVFDRLPPRRQVQEREKACAQARRWKEANPEKVASWLENNRHRLVEYTRRYRAKKRLARAVNVRVGGLASERSSDAENPAPK